MMLPRKTCKVLGYLYISSLLICGFAFNVYFLYNFKVKAEVKHPNQAVMNYTNQANFHCPENNVTNAFTGTYQCLQTMDVSPRFIEVKKGTLLYSAWFDDRSAQNYIQILLMTSRRKQPPSLLCRYLNEENCTTSTRAVTPYHEINGRYSDKRYGLFVASCVLPKDLVRIPNFVDVSINLFPEAASNCIVLPVGNTRKKKSGKRDYGICIAPLFGNIRVDDLVEFLELSQLLGASYFTFYDFEIADNVRKVLKHYESKGLVEVLSWKLPSYITGEDVHYFGQIFAMQDCLFRSINQLNFVAFNDLDEFIVPLQHENMPSLLHSIHKLNYCGHCFQSAKFPRVESKNEPSLRLSTQTVLHRLSKADMTHTKCVDDPQRVFEHGVHLIMEPLKGYKPNDVSWNEARVFHYRNCRAPCNLAADMEVDMTMQKYGERLIKNVILGVVDSKVFH